MQNSTWENPIVPFSQPTSCKGPYALHRHEGCPSERAQIAYEEDIRWFAFLPREMWQEVVGLQFPGQWPMLARGRLQIENLNVFLLPFEGVQSNLQENPTKPLAFSDASQLQSQHSLSRIDGQKTVSQKPANNNINDANNIMSEWILFEIMHNLILLKFFETHRR
jgi:hypothetical protein